MRRLLLGTFACALAGCHASSASPASGAGDAGATDAGAYVPQFHPLDSDGRVLRDAQGRTVVLRGYNVKVNGLFDVTPDNGDPVRETIPVLDGTDFTLMQANGVNVLRLPVSWSAFEPAQGAYQTAYLDAIDAFLNQVRPYGFYVLLDFHEDGWSKDLCEDGAPAWATVVDPDDWEGGLVGADCHASNAALSAHTSFFQNDADQLQEAFVAMLGQFATHFAGNETVFGYEIFNEPISTDPLVDAFSIKAATALRAVDPGHLILWEPSAIRNQLNSSLISTTPFPVPGSVYAVHIYCAPEAFESSIGNARTEAAAWGEPLFITEHGANPLSDGGLSWIDQWLTGFDQAVAGSVDWIWNPGAVTREDGGPIAYVDDGGVLTHLTRPYAMAVGGDVDSTVWDGTTLTMKFHAHPGVPQTHDVYWNQGTPRITCNGSTAAGVTSDTASLVYHLACGNGAASTLVFAPGGP